ncbi:unnamed protein product [Arctia plantaginis]|uniref:HTH CENPB-type domain-containing protein n=1 Tax=Arctia plantaginis TaxID=874455 RepID=A0A8S0YZY8_ARCPL|nr:unnamed protein product [Arctia plantaginis]
MGAGVKRVLPENVEEYTVSCIKTRAQMGQLCQKEELKLLVKQYVESKQLKTPFTDNKPGDDWYLSFMKRHPELSLKKPEHLQKARVDARKPYIVYDFYNTLKCVMNENNLQDKPDFIYNCDESGFQSDPRSRVDPSKFPKDLFKHQDLQVYTNIINDIHIQHYYHEFHNETEHIVLTQQREEDIEQQYLTTTWEQNNRIEIQNNKNETQQEFTNTLEHKNRNEIQQEPINTLHDAVDIAETADNYEQQKEVGQSGQQFTRIHTTRSKNQQVDKLSESILPGTSKRSDMMTVMEDNNNTSPLINKILKLISLDTGTADHIKRKISSAFINSVVTDDEIKSPSKEQIEKIVGIKPIKK